MGKNASWILVVILLAVSGYFFVQNMKLKKHVAELDNSKAETVAVTPGQDGKEANPQGASPFDKPNVDPAADQLVDPKVKDMPKTVIKFDNPVHDFGRINEGEHVATKFRFTNTGKGVLLISHAQASCGCTVPQAPKDPIKPGESNEIAVIFNSEGKRGETEKTVTIEANTEPIQTVLTIKATIIPRDK